MKKCRISAALPNDRTPVSITHPREAWGHRWPKAATSLCSANLSHEEVSRTYGVPKLLLGDFERATYANVQASERMFWRNTVVPEVKFLEEQLNRMLLPRLGYPQLTVEFDLSAIEALQEDENNRVQRESALLDRGVLTINEVRRERNLPEVPWGDRPTGQ